MEMLGQAIRLAANAHSTQFDKGGKPYILHPLFLMNQLLYDTELAIIAVLHDVIEDTLYTLTELIEYGYSERVILALALLTHNTDETYEEYIEGICTNYDAIRVKRKDLDHNSRILRLKGTRPKDFERLEKYHRAYVKLGEARKKFK